LKLEQPQNAGEPPKPKRIIKYRKSITGLFFLFFFLRYFTVRCDVSLGGDVGAIISPLAALVPVKQMNVRRYNTIPNLYIYRGIINVYA